jgi:hypothetical protein
MAELELPRPLNCPKCGMALVLLPLALYPRAAEWDSAQLAKFSGDITYPDGNVVAMFTVADATGKYTCPACENVATA